MKNVCCIHSEAFHTLQRSPVYFYLPVLFHHPSPLPILHMIYSANLPAVLIRLQYHDLPLQILSLHWLPLQIRILQTQKTKRRQTFHLCHCQDLQLLLLLLLLLYAQSASRIEMLKQSLIATKCANWFAHEFHWRYAKRMNW